MFTPVGKDIESTFSSSTAPSKGAFTEDERRQIAEHVARKAKVIPSLCGLPMKIVYYDTRVFVSPLGSHNGFSPCGGFDYEGGGTN